MAFLAGLLGALGASGATAGAADAAASAAPAAGAASALGSSGGGKGSAPGAPPVNTSPLGMRAGTGPTADLTGMGNIGAGIPGTGSAGTFGVMAPPASASMGLPDPTAVPGSSGSGMLPNFQTPFAGPIGTGGGLGGGTPGGGGMGGLLSGLTSSPYGKLFIQYLAAKHRMSDPYAAGGFLAPPSTGGTQ